MDYSACKDFRLEIKLTSMYKKATTNSGNDW